MEPTPSGENKDIFYLFIYLILTIGQDTRTVSKLKNNPEKKIAAFYENAYPNAPFSILSDVEFAVYLSGCCGLFSFFAIPRHMTLLSPHSPFQYPLSTGFLQFTGFLSFQFGALLPSLEPSAWAVQLMVH